MPASSTPAIEALRRAGIDHRVHVYELPERHGRSRQERPDYGLEAAAALGVDPARVCKTLIAALDDGRLAAAVLPVDRHLDLKALAAALGTRRAVLADPGQAERATGSVIGGISPLGSRRPLPVVVDEVVLEAPTILLSAGRRGLQVEVAPADLISVLGAAVGPIGRPAS